MMKANNIMSAGRGEGMVPFRSVNPDMPVINVLPRLLDAPGRILGVSEDGKLLGVIDRDSILEGLGRMIAARDDSSVISVECAAADYSASRLAHAVEDSDAHLVDMLTLPAEDGRISAMLRVRRSDPTPTVRSLERYGFEVVDVESDRYDDSERAAMRLLELKTILNV